MIGSIDNKICLYARIVTAVIAVRRGKQDAFEAITAVIQGICRKTQPDGAVRFCTYVLLERDGE